MVKQICKAIGFFYHPLYYQAYFLFRSFSFEGADYMKNNSLKIPSWEDIEEYHNLTDDQNKTETTAELITNIFKEHYALIIPYMFIVICSFFGNCHIIALIRPALATG